ncbi:molybdenum transport system permease protein modb [hydrocarbon metagenome]|uniref:Molybdenum transport system permease protein modb n=1 Tax=hydrocarbon metagenome TaxID=938273 RepID=A0A0W8FF27_9ZZZZ
MEVKRLRQSCRAILLTFGTGVLITLLLIFIVTPILALLFRISPDRFCASLSDPVVWDALVLSLTTATISTCVIVLLGTPVAWINARYCYSGREFVDTIIDLPLVLPPAVAGLALLMAFGRMGIIGRYFYESGISIAFTTLAVIIAQVFVALPFYVRQARASFEQLDTMYEQAARSLGSTTLPTFFIIVLPLVKSGLIAGAIMSFARALGEFGATIMFAGNIQGRTQTMPLAIYTTMQGDLNASITLSVILIIISFVVLFIVKFKLRRDVRF